MTGIPSLFQRLFALTGKTALITGATGGIGQVLAAALAEAGVTVGVHGRTQEKVENLCASIVEDPGREEKGGEAKPFIADLRQVDACRKLIAEAHQALGRLDILINCAAINRRKPVEAITEDDFDTIMAVNLRSIFFLCQAAHPIMRAQGGGKIINIGSINATYGLGTISVYGASKSGLAQITRVMAVEWARDNIQVNNLTPGFILTSLTEGPLWGIEHRSRWLHDRIPARRPGKPEELVGAALLLASEASSYVSYPSLKALGFLLQRDCPWGNGLVFASVIPEVGILQRAP